MADKADMIAAAIHLLAVVNLVAIAGIFLCNIKQYEASKIILGDDAGAEVSLYR